MLNKIKEQTILAMKSKDKDRLAILRQINAQIKQFEVDKRLPVDEAILIDLLNSMIKKRLESIDAFTKGNRLDLVEKEQYELSVIEEFLPKQYSDEEINGIIDNVFSTLDNPSMKDFGKIMKQISTELKGKCRDLSKVSSIIKLKLQG